MSSGDAPDPRIQGLFDSPEMLLRDISLEQKAARFLPMTELGYRASAGLDKRAVTQGLEGFALPVDDVLGLMHRAEQPVRPTDFLFHVGHCGSTLLSRLLGELPGHFVLRDPMPLTRVSQAVQQIEQDEAFDAETVDKMLAICVGLLGRTYAPEERALVKPAFLAFPTYRNLFRAHPDNRAVLLDLDLETFLASVLRPKLMDTHRGFVDELYRTPWRNAFGEELDVAAMGPGEIAAVMWLMHQLSLQAVVDEAAAQDGAERVLRLRFEDYLADPAGTITRISAALGFEQDPQLVAELVASPLTERHAKDTEQAYSAAMREEALSSARETYADDIRAGQVFAYGRMRDLEGLAGLEARA